MQIKLCKNRFSLVLVATNLTVEQRWKLAVAVAQRRASRHSRVRYVLSFFTVDAKVLASGRAKRVGVGWSSTVRKGWRRTVWCQLEEGRLGDTRPEVGVALDLWWWGAGVVVWDGSVGARRGEAKRHQIWGGVALNLWWGRWCRSCGR
ncbi:hypothetical protein GUJ93_ZPchr0006g45586 [Zizania palustris]|uniref:Uncharacterized protein n=1 Tax=Zizania palustris TaxID=103762 RepID=A0A8J5SX76_ZIZPA|nr:hypothetical protein GUJ93_ZPchr0006g45586 [Zizania palustris]